MPSCPDGALLAPSLELKSAGVRFLNQGFQTTAAGAGQPVPEAPRPAIPWMRRDVGEGGVEGTVTLQFFCGILWCIYKNNLCLCVAEHSRRSARVVQLMKKAAVRVCVRASVAGISVILE